MKGEPMKNGRCPKCGSNKIYAATDLPLKGGPFASNSIPVSLTSMASLDNYVCIECGLVESYVAEKDKLAEIARKWTAVNEDMKPAE
jgi:predicted nucleic-acid-binding Zn-ribbon protein